MKKIITFLATVLLCAGVYAQAPQKMSYQAVIRNSSNALVTNAAVGMRLSVLQGSAAGTAVYVETQQPATNANGLVSLEIGSGTVVSGTFASINWGNGPFFIKTETDPAGGTNYTITGTSQLLSVPYAQYSSTAAGLATTATVSPNQITSGGAANGNVLQYNGTNWAPAPKPAVYTVSGAILSIAPVAVGEQQLWVAAGPTTTISLSAGQSISANFCGSLRNNGGVVNNVTMSIAVCYQDATIANAPIYALYNANVTDAVLSHGPNLQLFCATAGARIVPGTTIPTVAQIPPGTYKVFLGIKNKSTSNTIAPNDLVNGTITVF